MLDGDLDAGAGVYDIYIKLKQVGFCPIDLKYKTNHLVGIFTFSPLVSLEKMTNQFNKLVDDLGAAVTQEPLQMCSLHRLWVSMIHPTFDFVLVGVHPGFPCLGRFGVDS
jgi:hypothetical protein